jgi:hypothetical protein
VAAEVAGPLYGKRPLGVSERRWKTAFWMAAELIVSVDVQRTGDHAVE